MAGYRREVELAMSKEFVMPSAKSAWSHHEIRKLRTLAAEQMSIGEIARTLRRTESSIRNKAAFHGISLRGLQCASESV